MCLVKRVTNSVIKLVDASPVRGGVGVNCFADLHPEKYWKNKKYYKLIVENCRLVRYVVLDVELCSSPFSVVGEERRPSKTQNGTDNNGVYEIDCVNANQTGDVVEEIQKKKKGHCIWVLRVAVRNMLWRTWKLHVNPTLEQ